MKTHIVLGILFLLTACNPKVAPEQKATSAIGGGDGSAQGGTIGGSNGGAVEVSAPVVGTLNYNQLNMTYAKLTGINQSRVNDDFEVIKGSLPSSNDIDAMTSFNLVSKVRLADAYCGLYVGTNSTNGQLNDTLVNNDANVIDHLLRKFTDYDSANPIYDDLKAELTNIMNNSDGATPSGTLIPSNPATLNRNLAILACIATLASSHVTIIE